LDCFTVFQSFVFKRGGSRGRFNDIVKSQVKALEVKLKKSLSVCIFFFLMYVFFLFFFFKEREELEKRLEELREKQKSFFVFNNTIFY
jgi:predicted PurR-regulated permease PerM